MGDRQGGTPGARPHAQPVRSCHECRRKKLRCDRQKPCGRCEKLNRGSECSYALDYSRRSMPQRTPESRGYTRPLGMPWEPTWHSTPTQARQSHSTAETSPFPGDQGRSSAGLHATASSQTQVPSADLKLHAKFQGKQLLSEFPAITTVMRDMESSVDESLSEMSSDLHTMQNMLAKWAVPLPLPDSLDHVSLFYQLRENLPLQEECDGCVDVYFESFGGFLRISRRCDFAKKYNAFWQRDNIGQSDTFLLLLTMMVTLARIAQSKHKVALATIPRDLEVATRSTQLVRAWLSTIRPREIFSTQTLQIQILLWLFDAVLGAKPYKLWELSGNIYRSAIAQNLPQSALWNADKEETMEKRILWAAVLEIELQSSISVGLRSIMGLANSEYLLNLEDTYETGGRDDGRHSLVDTSFNKTAHLSQAYLARSVFKRFQAHSMICNTSRVNYRRALELAQDLEKMIRGRPEELSLDLTNSAPTSKMISFADRVAVDFLLRRSIVSLLTPFVLSSSTSPIAYKEGLLIWMRSALAMQSYNAYSKLPMNATGPSGSTDWSLQLPFLRLDLVQVALGVLLVLRESTLMPGPLAENPSEVDVFSYWDRNYLLNFVQGTVDYLVEPRPWARRDLKGPIGLLIALESCEGHRDEEQRNNAIKQRIMGLIERVLQREKTMLPHSYD